MSFTILKVMFYGILYDPAIREACPAVFEESGKDYMKLPISSIIRMKIGK